MSDRSRNAVPTTHGIHCYIYELSRNLGGLTRIPERRGVSHNEQGYRLAIGVFTGAPKIT